VNNFALRKWVLKNGLQYIRCKSALLLKMPVSSGNTHAAPQSASAAGNTSGKGIALKSPAQLMAAGDEAETGIQSAYISSASSAAPFKLSPQLKNGTVLTQQHVQANAATPVMQRVKLSNGTDTDNFTFQELEKMSNNPGAFGLDEDDVDTLYAAMDKINGGAPSAMDYQGADDDVDDDDYSDHEFFNFDTIPKNAHQEHIVSGDFYRFWNDGNRCVEFTDPKDKNVMGTITKATPVKIEKRVNIKGAGGKIKGIPTENLKQPKKKNYYHFKAANIEAGLGTAGTSPPGKTWHHHYVEGQMELLDRDVHAEFKHAGGKKYWGSV
jgi:hypothetical protein